MTGKQFGGKRQNDTSSLWTYFEFQQPITNASKQGSTMKSKSTSRSHEQDIDLFDRPLIDMILPQPKSQSVFYASTKSKPKNSSRSKGNTRIKRGKKA